MTAQDRPTGATAAARAWSWPSDRPPGRPARTTSRPSATATLGNGLPDLVADLPGRPLVSATIVLPTGAADEPAAGGRCDRDGRAGADRGHRAPRRHRADRGVRAAGGVAARRGRLGRHERRRGRARRAARRRRWSCSPRSCFDRPSRTARSSGCATSASTTCSRLRPTRAGAPTRPTSAPSTLRARRTTGRRPARARPWPGWTPRRPDGRTPGRSTRRAPRWSSPATWAVRTWWASWSRSWAPGPRPRPPWPRARSMTRRRARAGWSASSIGRAASRPRSASAIVACRATSPTSTRCRS